MNTFVIKNKIVVRILFFCFLIFYTLGNLDAQIFGSQSLKFSKTLDYIQKYYVDSVDTEELVEKAIVSMLEDLDPHSNYLTAEEVKAMNEPLHGNFEGIGISFNILNDTILVISPISGGPSEKLGIRAGDRIIKIDGENVAGIGITNQDIFDRLRGEKGTRVTVTILRKGYDELLEFQIVRDKIPIFSLDAAYMINKNTGYIKLNRFAATTVDEFEEALKDLREKNLKHLVLDLSGNGGGYMEEAIELADHFLEKNKLIVYTEGLHTPKREHDATSSGDFEDGKLIIIVDEGSASASEIVAGAIQDWDRGFIVGRRTFGKGLVQKPLYLHDGSMLRLTVARYHTPTGRMIQKSYKNGVEEYEREILERFKRGENLSQKNNELPDSLKYYTLKKNRIVYGGGGIMPDFFVPVDTSSYSDYYRELVRKGIISRFILDYLDKNREKLLNEYNDFDSFLRKFEITESFFNDFLAYAESEKVEKDEDALEKSGNDIKMLLKAYIARDIWNTSAFFQVYNTTNPALDKAIEIFNDWDKY